MKEWGLEERKFQARGVHLNTDSFTTSVGDDKSLIRFLTCPIRSSRMIASTDSSDTTTALLSLSALTPSALPPPTPLDPCLPLPPLSPPCLPPPTGPPPSVPPSKLSSQGMWGASGKATGALPPLPWWWLPAPPAPPVTPPAPAPPPAWRNAPLPAPAPPAPRAAANCPSALSLSMFASARRLGGREARKASGEVRRTW